MKSRSEYISCSRTMISASSHCLHRTHSNQSTAAVHVIPYGRLCNVDHRNPDQYWSSTRPVLGRRSFYYWDKLSLLKMFYFEKLLSFHPITNTSWATWKENYSTVLTGSVLALSYHKMLAWLLNTGGRLTTQYVVPLGIGPRTLFSRGRHANPLHYGTDFSKIFPYSMLEPFWSSTFILDLIIIEENLQFSSLMRCCDEQRGRGTA